MTTIKSFLLYLLASRKNYGLSQLRVENSINRPELAVFGTTAQRLVETHQNFLVWRKTRHIEWIWLNIIPIWFRWIDDEICLVGTIEARGEEHEITSFCDEFTERVRGNSTTKHHLVKQESIFPAQWEWNPARSEWSHIEQAHGPR